MPLTPDDFKAVVANLKEDYFLVHRQTVVLLVALLAALGIGLVATAYTAAKTVAVAEAEKIAKTEVEKKVPQTVEALLAQLETLKTKASAAVAETEHAQGRVKTIEDRLSGNVADKLRTEFTDEMTKHEQQFLKLDSTGGVEILGSLKVKGSATVGQDFSALGVRAKTFDG